MPTTSHHLPSVRRYAVRASTRLATDMLRICLSRIAALAHPGKLPLSSNIKTAMVATRCDSAGAFDADRAATAYQRRQRRRMKDGVFESR